MLNNKTLITAQTTEATAEFKVYSNNPVTIIGWGFSGDDSAAVEITYDGENYVPCAKQATADKVSSDDNPITVYGPGFFRINKGTTTGSVGIAICRNQGA